LPPTGISSKEHYDKRNVESADKASNRGGKQNRRQRSSDKVDLNPLPSAARLSNPERPSKEGSERRGKKSKKNRRHQRRVNPDECQSGSSISSSTNSSRNRPQKISKRVVLLEKERRKLFKQWKAEARAEAEAKRMFENENRWFRRFGRSMSRDVLKRIVWLETLFANMPLTIGSIAVANATLGVDWFKFTEESLASCRPVHFHSTQCTFPEVSTQLRIRLFSLLLLIPFCFIFSFPAASIAIEVLSPMLGHLLFITCALRLLASSPCVSSPSFWSQGVYFSMSFVVPPWRLLQGTYV
jgi:hypothetical protein